MRMQKIKRLLFPSSHEKMVSKWKADKGDERLRLDYQIDQNAIVMDLGGYQGEWAHQIFERYKSTVLVFEPVEKFADRIRQRFTDNDKISTFQSGLGDKTRHEEISTSGDASSVFTGDGPTESIEIIDVVTFMDEHDISHVDLMKINIEGGEYELLRRLVESGYIERIENIQVQFHNFVEDAEAQMSELQHALTKTHFPTYQYKFVWENWTKKSNNS